MGNFEMRVSRLEEKRPSQEDNQFTVVRTIVAPGEVDKEANHFEYKRRVNSGGHTENILSRLGESMDEFIKRVRELTGKTSLIILARYIDPDCCEGSRGD